jgi:hypothetical protein
VLQYKSKNWYFSPNFLYLHSCAPSFSLHKPLTSLHTRKDAWELEEMGKENKWRATKKIRIRIIRVRFPVKIIFCHTFLILQPNSKLPDSLLLKTRGLMQKKKWFFLYYLLENFLEFIQPPIKICHVRKFACGTKVILCIPLPNFLWIIKKKYLLTNPIHFTI